MLGDDAVERFAPADRSGNMVKCAHEWRGRRNSKTMNSVATA
jgi:hypothetical protein